MFDFSFFTLGAYGKCYYHLFILCVFLRFTIVSSVVLCFFLFLLASWFFSFFFVSFEFGASLKKNNWFECAAHRLYDFGLCGPRGLRGPWDPHISQTFYTHLLPTHPFNHQLSVGDYAVQLCVPNFAFPLSQPSRLSTLTPCLCPLLDWCSIFPV